MPSPLKKPAALHELHADARHETFKRVAGRHRQRNFHVTTPVRTCDPERVAERSAEGAGAR
jgi:hypothetical protein